MSEIFKLPTKSVDWDKYKSDPSVNGMIIQFDLKMAEAANLENIGTEPIDVYFRRKNSELTYDFAQIEEKIAEVKRKRFDFINQIIITGATVISLIAACFGIYYSNKSITLAANSNRPYLAIETKFKDPLFFIRVPPYIDNAVYANDYFGTIIIKLSNVGASPAENAVVKTVLFNDDTSLFYESNHANSEIVNPILKDFTVQISEQIPFHPQILLKKTLVIIVVYFDLLTESNFKQVLYFKFDIIDNRFEVLFQDSDKVRKLSKSLNNNGYI